MVIKQLKPHFFNSLKNSQDEQEIESFFFILTEYLHNLKRIDVALNPNFELSDEEVEKWNAILAQLQQEKPIQYITGEAWFYGLKFEVNENTLIPRPETEELVEWIIESWKLEAGSWKSENQKRINVLDIGTGSGCIPIALKANLPEANVSAIDVSEQALEVAKRNAVSNNVEVNFIQANILEVEDVSKIPNSKFQIPNSDHPSSITRHPSPVIHHPSSIIHHPSSITHHPSSYNIIVSNPPYVRNLEKQEIKKNVLDYEPHLALFVEDDDALLFYRKIAQLAMKNLSENGLLFFEINQYLGNETVDLLQNLGFKNIELKKDVYGNDRMIKCNKY